MGRAIATTDVPLLRQCVGIMGRAIATTDVPLLRHCVGIMGRAIATADVPLLRQCVGIMGRAIAPTDVPLLRQCVGIMGRAIAPTILCRDVRLRYAGETKSNCHSCWYERLRKLRENGPGEGRTTGPQTPAKKTFTRWLNHS